MNIFAPSSELQELLDEGLYTHLQDITGNDTTTRISGSTDLTQAYNSIAKLNQNKPHEAIAGFVECIPRIDVSNHPYIHEAFADSYGRISEFSAASEIYTKIIASSPNVSPSVYIKRGTMLQCTGNHELAVADFTQVISLDSAATSAMFRRAISLRILRLYEAAAEDFMVVRELRPGLPLFEIDFTQPNPLFTSAEGRVFLDLV